MACHPFPATVYLLDETFSHGPLGANIDLESLHSPLQHVVNESRNLAGLSNSTTDQPMVRRIRVYQRTTQKHPWRSFRMIPAMFRHQRLGDDFVPNITKCGYAVG